MKRISLRKARWECDTIWFKGWNVYWYRRRKKKFLNEFLRNRFDVKIINSLQQWHCNYIVHIYDLMFGNNECRKFTNRFMFSFHFAVYNHSKSLSLILTLSSDDSIWLTKALNWRLCRKILRVKILRCFVIQLCLMYSLRRTNILQIFSRIRIKKACQWMSEIAVKKHRILIQSSKMRCFFRATSDIQRQSFF